MKLDNKKYLVYRSRDNGNFWSLLSHGICLGFEEATSFVEEEKRKHPSDWLAIVVEETSVVSIYKGNKKKKGNPNV